MEEILIQLCMVCVLNALAAFAMLAHLSIKLERTVREIYHRNAFTLNRKS